ncbi:unnamed protein product [Parnassius mnemosyne]|uniref:Nuclear apoptosis-inducing factor 1 n=1 Tax=Parnassius mnemosyne TaxID=213953 RepID=A0AAV1L8P8_9NEOP
MWEKIALKLNSLGGCVKTSKQWMKYWADKKSAVKKKGALRFRTKNKTGGGAEVVELSGVEERILTLLGGESFAIGDRHLEINPFEDTHASLDPPTDNSSPSLLTNQLFVGLDATPPNTMEQDSITNIVLAEDVINIPTIETPQQPRLECVPGTSHLSTRPSVVRIVTQSPMPRAQTVPSTPPRVGSPVCPMPTTPSGSGRHPQRGIISSWLDP